MFRTLRVWNVAERLTCGVPTKKRIMQVTLTLQDYLTQDILELTQARTVVDAVTQIVEEWIAAKKSPVPTADDNMFDIDAIAVETGLPDLATNLDAYLYGKERR